ncbi:MAG: hypothetical protein EBT18_07560 [Gammaproteobacteria bacterium]|nr:hypothetical protein [Gammaproteobacteria bacterium]
MNNTPSTMELNAISGFVPSEATANAYRKRVEKLIEAVPDLNAGNDPLLFVPSRWLADGRLAEVQEALSDKSASTQRSYIAAVCKYLSALSHEQTVYHAELAALLKVAQVSARINKAASDEMAEEVDLNAVQADSRTPLSIRALVQLIQCGEQVKLTNLIGRTVKDVVRTLPKDTGNIGLPMPGHEIKLIPNGGKLEIRMRGPNITPGYYKEDDLTAKAFDEEKFFRIGDAGKFEDEDDPSKGVVFDGRVAENFKLLSGTWVHAGQLRLQAIAAASPVIQDAVVTGQDRDDVGLLVFPSIAGCQSVAGDKLSSEAIVSNVAIHKYLRSGLAAHNSDNPGSSTRIRRVLLMIEPPQIDAGEITDKGYINQRMVLDRRKELVDRLYSGTDDDIVVVS